MQPAMFWRRPDCCRDNGEGGVLTKMVVTWVQARIHPHKEAEVLSAIDHLISRMSGQHRCEMTRLLSDCADPHSFFIVSEWASSADVHAFLASSDFEIFKGMRMLLRSQPIVVVDDVRHRLTRLITP